MPLLEVTLNIPNTMEVASKRLCIDCDLYFVASVAVASQPAPLEVIMGNLKNEVAQGEFITDVVQAENGCKSNMKLVFMIGISFIMCWTPFYIYHALELYIDLRHYSFDITTYWITYFYTIVVPVILWISEH